MAKKKTSKKQKFLLKDMPKMNLKSKKGIKPFTASKNLKNKNYVKKVLFGCFVHNDMEGFKEVLRTHFDLVNKDEVIKKVNISKTTFYRTLSKKSNPTLRNISKLLKAI